MSCIDRGSANMQKVLKRWTLLHANKDPVNGQRAGDESKLGTCLLPI